MCSVEGISGLQAGEEVKRTLLTVALVIVIITFAVQIYNQSRDN
jgi:hypothetical protein